MKSHIRQFIETFWSDNKTCDLIESELTEAIKKDEEASGQFGREDMIGFAEWIDRHFSILDDHAEQKIWFDISGIHGEWTSSQILTEYLNSPRGTTSK